MFSSCEFKYDLSYLGKNFPLLPSLRRESGATPSKGASIAICIFPKPIH